MPDEPGATMRLDRFLWYARIAKTRPLAQTLAGSGHLRIDGRAVDRPAAPVRIGNVLTFADHLGMVHALRIAALPARRGPSAEARACYVDLANVSQKAPGD
jgi:ribosome-associated heat shock protein Hsp15